MTAPDIAGRLAALAFEREHAAAYHEWQRLDWKTRRAAMADANVLLSVVTQAARLSGAKEAEAERFAAEIQSLLSDVAADLRAARRDFPPEWFQALERWAGAALDGLNFDCAAKTLELAFDTGAAQHPGLFQALRASEAELRARSGPLEQAAEIALWYARRPYLLPERRKLPQVYMRLLAALLLTGHIKEHRVLLWSGLREAYLRPALRSWFAQKIRRTYRGYLKALFRSGARFGDRVQLLAHLAFAGARRVWAFRVLRLHRPLYWMGVVLGYELNRRNGRHIARGRTPLNAILVTRAMGGIGDLLMMTPGLCALARAHPGSEVHFAVPRRFLPLFSGIDEFSCIDIESPSLDPARYRAWFDLTDCPAARKESRQLPNVRVGRIEIFARALGVPAWKVRGSAARPRYVITPAERLAAEQETEPLRRTGRPLVGLHWHAAESYRDYPHNVELLRLLAERCNVLVFGARSQPATAIAGVRFVAHPLRAAFAQAAQCDVLVGPDSSFLHLAGALGKPMVLAAGPVDGMLRAKPYPSVVPIVPNRRDFPCAPCWRNESINCHMSGRRESVCLRSIAPATVAATVFSLLSRGAPADRTGEPPGDGVRREAAARAA
jgi:ADP-heptose:LPS heptosyltransferase